jgi:hypothetical protein
MNSENRSRLPAFCPLQGCPSRSPAPPPGRIVRKGFFRRSSDAKIIPRFLCHRCGKTFSSARYSPAFRQKKRFLNERIRRLLCSGVSQRRIARLLGISRTTVERKFLFLAERAWVSHLDFLEELPEIVDVQFDEMESFERSKCLPLSIPIVVLPESRKILGVGVASMPAKGPLAQISRRKYGSRVDERQTVARDLLSSLGSCLDEKVRVLSDQNPNYPGWIGACHPGAHHDTVKGRRGCVVGQGELKRIGWDPLFSLNHTAAMIRANVNRLFRRTWCTTKRKDRLEAHLMIYLQYHNEVLTEPLRFREQEVA